MARSRTAVLLAVGLLPYVSECKRINKASDVVDISSTASCGGGAFHFNLGGQVLGFNVADSTSDAADVSVDCPASARNPSGHAVFRCHGSGRWMLVTEGCSHVEGGECGAGNFQIAFGGHRQVFSLSPTAAGMDARMPCQFGPFTEGEVIFRCSSSGAWQMGGNNCVLGTGGAAEEEEVPPSCPAANFPLAFGGETASYQMPAGAIDQEVDHDCAFGDLNRGKISFVCGANRRWALAGNNCRRASECGHTEYSLMMHEHNHSFILNRASAGTRVSRPCAFGEHTAGDVFFRCTEGEWVDLAESECLKPGQCPATVIEHDLGWIQADLGEAGDTVVKMCDFDRLTEGNVNLQCRDGSWQVISHDCHEEVLPEGMMCQAREAAFSRIVLGMWTTAEEQRQDVTFQLPLAPQGVSRLPCMVERFVGEVSFMCHEDGEWTLLRTPGSNTCHQANFREWEDYYLRGKAEGWIP